VGFKSTARRTVTAFPRLSHKNVIDIWHNITTLTTALLVSEKLLVAEVASIQFGNDRMSGFQQADDGDTAIVDVRLKIALRE